MWTVLGIAVATLAIMAAIATVQHRLEQRAMARRAEANRLRQAALWAVADEAARAQVARYRNAYYRPPTVYGLEALAERQDRIAMHHMRIEAGVTCPDGCPARDHEQAAS